MRPRPISGDGIASELLAAGFEDPEQIRRDGFGPVYRCLEQPLRRSVAVKVIVAALDDQRRGRFLRNQRMTTTLSTHPNIAPVLRVGVTESGFPFLVTPFYRRGSLEQWIHRDGALPWPDVLSIGVKLAGALAAGHATGVVHGDVNPTTTLISDFGEPQLAHFGLGEMYAGLTAPDGIITGPPAHISPEVLQGSSATAVSDVYGLGSTLFTALTGHAACTRKQGRSLVGQFTRVGIEPVPDLRAIGVPAPLCSVVEAAIEYRPEDRPATAREFVARLHNVQFCLGLPVDPVEATVPAGATEPVVRRRLRPPVTPITRFLPPVASGRLVDRPRLLRMLRDGQPRRLVLIHAPPGYGKSTLAAQWAAELAGDGIPVAWLTLVADDNSPAWFLTRLVEAVVQVRPDLSGELTQALDEGIDDSADRVLTRLINEVHEGGRTVAVVLDGWHRIHSGAIREAMRFLLDNACPHLRLIVLSRSSTGLPLAHMRVRDELVEIDENALRFDNSEAECLLLDIGGLPLARAQVDQLRAVTEGWAAALQLASLSLRAQRDPAVHIDRIAGHHTIGEYLMESVIDHLEPDLLGFMMSTAVTDKVCADLAEALTATSPAQDVLEQIVQRDLFLRSIDDERRWFRYHNLFAGFLRQRLARVDPDLPQRLHAVASSWFADHAMAAEAVDHALAAGEPERAVALVADHADDLLAQGRMAMLLALADKLPRSLAEADARLQIDLAWAQMSLFHLDAARAARGRAEAIIAARPADEGSDDLAFEAEILKLAHMLQSDHFDELSPAARQRLVRPADSYLAQIGARAAATTAFFRFDFDETRRWYEWAAPHRGESRSFLVVLDNVMDTMAAMAAFEQLDIETAEAILRHSMTLTFEAGPRARPIRILPAAHLAELLYHTGQFAEADELIPAGEDIEAANVEVMLAAYGTSARLAGLRGDMPAAQQCLDRGHRVAHRLALPRLSARMLNERIRLGLPVTQDERRRLDRLGPYQRQPDHIRATTAELDHDSAIRILLAQRSPTATEQAVDAAENLFHKISEQHRPRAILQAQLLYGGCLAAAGATVAALAQLTPALARCADTGLVRFAVDSAGPALAAIAETLHSAPEDPGVPPRRFLQRLLDDIEAGRGAPG